MPAADTQFVYAVGEGQARTRSEAEKAAVVDAMGKLAALVGITVTAKTIDVMSSRDSENATLAETRSSARGLVRDAEAAATPWIEIERGSRFWPFGRTASVTAHILLRWPQASLARERQRQSSAWRDYRGNLDHLGQKIMTATAKAGLEKIAVGPFVEATTRRPYAFTQVLKRDVADALVRAGLQVVPATGADGAVVGTYRVVGAEVVVAAQVYRLNPRANIGVADIALDRAMIEPAWLDSPSPVEPAFEALEPERAETLNRVGAVSVTSKPDGAQVFIDGDVRGRTPVTFGGVAVGERNLMILVDGYEPNTEKIRVTEGEITNVSAALQPKVGDLTIRSKPSEAEVLHDGRSLGRTPLKLTDLAVGSYALTVRHVGYEDATLSAEVRHTEVAVQNVELVEKPGSVFVVSDPPGGVVFLDGIRVGKAEAPHFLKLESVAAGQHQLAVSKDGVGVWGGMITVHADKTESIAARLKNNVGVLSLLVWPRADSIEIMNEDAAGASGSVACESHFPCMGAASLGDGSYLVRIAASGYETEERRVRIRTGRKRTLKIAMTEGDSTIRNGPLGHVFGRLMPFSKSAFADPLQNDDSSGVGLILADCIISPLLAIGVAADVVAFPFRLAALPGGMPDRPAVVKPSEDSPRNQSFVAQTTTKKNVADMSPEELDRWLHRGVSR